VLERACREFRDAGACVQHKRVIQHNIRVIATYYQNIRVPRLAQVCQCADVCLALASVPE
jgi:hypothetical protein